MGNDNVKLVISSIFIIILTSASLLIFSHYNKYKRIERYFYNNNKNLYIVIKICYNVLFISMVFNIRFVVYEIIKNISQKHFKISLAL